MNLRDVQARLAKSDDADAIARMSRDLVEHGLTWRWHRHRVLHSINNVDTNCLITTQASESAANDTIVNELTGFAITLFGEHEAHIALLAVHPKYQRRGIGQYLVRWQELAASAAGIRKVSLEVRATNHSAISFYYSLGYVDDGVLRNYYENQEDALKMVHLL